MLLPAAFLRTPSSKRFASTFVENVRRQELIQSDEKSCRESLRGGSFLLMHRGQPLLSRKTRGIAWMDYASALECNRKMEEEFVFLGLDLGSPASGGDGEKPFFACPVPDQKILRGRDEELRFLHLRRAVFTLADDEVGSLRSLPRLSKAWSLLRWHRKSTFCPNCGERSERNFSGSHRSCPSCGEVQYPRTSPVGIALPVAPDGSGVLLIRQPVYPPGMFSCVAGFVDAGESLAECVRREVAEEVGVEVGAVRVRDSQHWPYPDGSLMVGCEAELVGQGQGQEHPEPTVDGNEIEEARWFAPAELRRAFENSTRNPLLRFSADNSPDNLFVPPRQAIAHHLIKAWLTDNGHL